MAWDFTTEPEFQAQLDRMAAFAREEVWPLGQMHEVLGTSVLAPSLFGNQAPDSGNSELLDRSPRAGHPDG